MDPSYQTDAFGLPFSAAKKPKVENTSKRSLLIYDPHPSKKVRTVLDVAVATGDVQTVKMFIGTKGFDRDAAADIAYNNGNQELFYLLTGISSYL